MLRVLSYVLVFLSFNVFSAANPGTLTLESYLSEVSQKGGDYLGAKNAAEGAALRTNEGSLLTTPSLFANIQLLDDKKPTANPGFQGNQTRFLGYSLGVQEQFSFGLSAKLYYSLNHTEISGALPNFLPVPDFYEASPKLELSQSLLRNGFGRETRATQELAESGAKAQKELENFKAKAKLAEAEGTYWSLALTRELVRVQNDSVERAKKIRDWSKRRAGLELADRSDLLQAEAGLQARTLEYQTALDEAGALERRFNQLRGSTADKVAESLEPISDEALSKIQVPEKKGLRGDVKAAEAAQKVAEASAQLGKEKNLPTLDLVGSVAMNGRSDQSGTAVGDSFKTETPTYAIGLKFATPLDFGTVFSDREGYVLEQKAAELRTRQAQADEVHDWRELSVKLEEAKRRLSMSHDFEKKQEEKLENERKRLTKGRSVTYQVLLFEQDYLQAQALRLKTAGEVLRILAQMKLFSEGK